ncbi:MAG: V-type ATP synthase subunit F [Oscillospiraceae bacterium]|jgi:V/A-type H+-transporting ATPase subunit F|nr:V-type ATP synthase subunit F [Oscillospiraceae bacterium]
MYKIAIIGGADTVIGFKALGLEPHPVSSDEEARAEFKKLTGHDERYAIIYLEERLAKPLAAEIAKFNDKVTPAVILIPGREGSMGLSMSAIHDAALRAIGTDIL